MKNYFVYDGCALSFKDDEGNQRFFVIERDSCPSSPREWDNISQLYCWRHHGGIGDDNPYEGPVDLLEDLFVKYRPEEFLDDYLHPQDLIEALESDVFITNLYAYEHSGLAIKAGDQNPFRDPWDSGFLGLAVVEKDRLFEFGRQDGDWRAHAKEAVDAELEVYQEYLDGEVYGFVEYATDGYYGPSYDSIDSCWGFYGNNLAENDMLDHMGIPYEALEDGRLLYCMHEVTTQVKHDFYPLEPSPIDEMAEAASKKPPHADSPAIIKPDVRRTRDS